MPTSIDGLVLIDKPAGPTSFDVVRMVQRALGASRAGHTGTLDPFASGLLVILVGGGTRLAAYVPDEPKTYLATMTFGSETTTDDSTGDVTATHAIPDRADVDAGIARLTGTLAQLPPSFSAKKVEGRRAYALARQGREPALRPVEVMVHEWSVLAFDNGALTARITCGRGTYVRALARDLGRLAASGAHLSALRRERAGPFTVESAATLEAVRDGSLDVRPLREALGSMPMVTLSEDDARRAGHGARIAAAGAGDRAALLHPDGRLLGLARRDAETWHPDVVLPS